MINLLENLFLNGFFIAACISLLLVLRRLKAGPSLADRVVAVDLLATILLTAIAVSSIYAKESLYFDIAMVLALFSFLGTAMFARFINSQERK
jgi:multicomponent Na+:H+ antiporter subunit F